MRALGKLSNVAIGALHLAVPIRIGIFRQVPSVSRLRLIALLPLAALLAGCNFVVLDPSGDIAIQQRDIVLISVALMLLIIIPVMILTVVFAWRYRATNTQASYDPDWHHSTQLELVIWAAPLLIIICLGALTWMGTHLLDPYRPLDRIAADTVREDHHEPLEVQVVALDWKWLFIYPEQGIASVNELAAPIDRPLTFRISASSVMNSFYIPALAGMIYAMPGMETKLHAVINEAGTYRGISANYSGAGFSGMHFRFHGLSDADFAAWVEKVKSGGGELSRSVYLDLFAEEGLQLRAISGVDPAPFKTWLLPHLRGLPRPLGMSALAAVTLASTPIDVLFGRLAVQRSWHAVFVLLRNGDANAA